MNILVTGGAGYIGSHTIIELLAAGFHPIIIDNFSNSNPEVIKRLTTITGQKIPYYQLDVSDKQALLRVLDQHPVEAAIHFAGLKAVGESLAEPLHYYRTNLDSTLTLCETLQAAGVKKLVFSSSATVYGSPDTLPLNEKSRTGVGITNPYGWTKYMIEQILRDICAADSAWQITTLRYFNPIGAHPSGLIGEDPRGVPNNLLPYVAQVAVGRREYVQVFGNDYDTKDGTGIRDYIHVTDLAKGHVAALRHLAPGNHVFNLGTGKGTSVLELLGAFQKAAGKTIPYRIMDRRPGDISACFADPSKANAELGWKAEKTVEEACLDSWRWQSQNPEGYQSEKESTIEKGTTT